MKIFFDLETIPVSEEKEYLVREQFEKKRLNQYGQRVGTVDEYLLGTSLDPNFGQILCIGYAVDDEPVDIIYGDSEADRLKEFWKIAKNANQLIGHNALAFDVPFLWKRSILHGLKPTLPIDKRMNSLVYDTMLAWDLAMPRKHTSLDLLAKLLGIPSSKNGINGALVYDYYRAGKLNEIYEYCKKDVEVTRAIYKKLTVNLKTI